MDNTRPVHGRAALRSRLQHVYWIGGGSGAGKSTVARRIADDYGLRLYATDDVMSDRADRSTPEDSPSLIRFMAMDMDERRLNRSPEVMLETFHWFRGEGFALIVDDLLRLPRTPGVVVEGFRLLPHLVQPLLAVRDHAVWLLPTTQFRQEAFDRRGSLWSIAGRTSDPERALRNLLERDRMFTERLREQNERLDLEVIEVDGRLAEDDLAQRAAEMFGLGLGRTWAEAATNPRAPRGEWDRRGGCRHRGPPANTVPWTGPPIT